MAQAIPFITNQKKHLGKSQFECYKRPNPIKGLRKPNGSIIVQLKCCEILR